MNEYGAPKTIVQCMRSHLGSEDIQTVGWWCLDVMVIALTIAG